NLLRRDAGDVVLEDAPNDVSFLGNDLALAGRDDAVLERAEDAVAEAGAAAGLAELDAPAQPSSRLVRQFLQEHRVHRALQADVEERDVAFGERDDTDAGEGQSLEEASGVFLIAAEAIERLGEHHV